MDALLAGLTRPLKRRRQVLVVASLSIMLAGSAAYALSYDRPSMNSAPTCDGGVHRLAGVWDAGRKGQVRDAFQASGARGADVTWTAFSRVLDGWATAWVAMHNQTCAETHLAGVQSPAILDLRMECLDRKRQQVQALVAVYSEKPDAGSLDRAVAAAENVSSISACADVANLRAVIPLPEDPAVRAKVNSLRQRLNRSYALSEAGRAAEGRAYTEPLKREADTLGYAPLAAEAALALARHLTNSSQADEAEKLLFDALKGAIAGRDSKLEANIWLTVLDSYIGKVRVQESLLFARIAELAVFRAGDDVRLRARLAHGTGHAEYIAERAQGAVRQFQLAVELWKKSDGAQSRGYTSALSQLGNTLAWIGRTREGIGYLEQALAIQRATLRPDHPDILFALRALRDWYRALGQFRKADELFEEWLELDSIDKGPGNRLTAFSLTELGLSDADLGNVHRAIERFTKALSIRRGQFKSPSPVLIYSYCVLGDAQRQAGLLREAEDSYNHANEEAIGAGIPPDDGFTSLGLIYNSRRRHRQALRHCRRAFEGLSKNYGEDSPLLLSTRECIADALIGTGDVAGARVILERPLAAINELDVSPQHLAGPRFQLARALWTTVADRPRARDLARSTLKSLASAEGDNRNLMLRIEAWLRSHAD